MRFLSVCSGIDCASVAWAPLGWSAAAFSEIEPFPAAVLAHHYPDVPNLGDMTKYKDWPSYAVDLLVGGTPCQSFSVAGLRKGLADPRGNLMLTFGAIAARYRPRWLVWENVPGVLSSDEGRDFGAFLGLLGLLGYGFAYRVLDAQFVRVDGLGRAVPQRRRRVFVVGHLGDWRRPAAVLLERQSLRGDPAPRRTSGQGIASALAGGARIRGGFSYDDIPVTPLLASGASGANSCGIGRAGDAMFALDTTGAQAIAFGGNNTSGPIEVATALNACSSVSGRLDFESETFIAQGAAIAFDCMASGMNGFAVGDVAGPLRVGTGTSGAAHQAVAFQGQGTTISVDGEISGTLRCGSDRVSSAAPAVQLGMKVRRLIPVECERLQGLPDNYTQIPWRGRAAAACPDGPRYKALGNSMAANVMRWLGTRIQMVEAISSEREAA